MFNTKAVFDVLPTGMVRGCAFSADGAYLAVAHQSSPCIAIYKRGVDGLVKLSAPSGLPAGNGWGCAFSPDGLHLAVAHENSPYISIYKRSGDTFTKLADPSTLPSGNGSACTFSPDGTHLVVVHSVDPYISIYKRDGDTFTKLANPAALPTGTGHDCAFSADGVYLAVAHSSAPCITIYKRDGDTFTKLADPFTLPSMFAYGCAFSPNGLYLVVGWQFAPYLMIYKRSGDTFTKLADPATTPPGIVYGCAFTSDSVHLAVVQGTKTASPVVSAYEVADDVFTALPAVTDPPAATLGWCCAFSPDDELLAVGHSTTPFITAWNTFPDAIPGKPINLSPKNSYISINEAHTFAWEHISASGTPSTGADLQYRQPDGAWQGLATIVGDESSATILADTFEAGSYQWRVRTYNQDGYPGEWSDPAAFMAVGVPATPLIAGATNSSRPVVTWSAGSQQGYQLQIMQGDAVIWDSLETAGIVQTRKVPIYLGNGEYKARVRIVNASMLWSAWAEQEFVIDVTGPAKPSLTAEATAGAAVLTFAATGAEKLYLLRDGIPIANVTGKTEYTDYAALGSTVYVLRAVDASDNYTDSDPVGVTVAVPCVMMAAVDALADTVQMRMKQSGQPGISRQKDVMGTAHYYAGRTRPVYRFSGFVGEQYSPAFYYTTSTDFARLEALIDKRLTILYRDNLGNKYYGVITGITHTQENYMYEFALAIMRVDYIEQIDYEV